jgi:DNA sulfur modification protein DndD
MTFDNLVLHNFSLYRGRQELCLTPRPDKPVILIGGLNGAGKTTILDALQLALYGTSARCSNRGSLSYHDFLRRCIHRGIDPAEGAAVEVQFHHLSAGREHSYRIHRSWVLTSAGVRERFEVQLDGKLDPVLTSAWMEHVDAFIPARIAHLFFFDGEKIEGLADSASSAELLSTAIHSVLGLDLVDRLASDLTVMERRKRMALKSSEERTAIDEIQAQLGLENKAYEQILQLRASAQNDLDLRAKSLNGIQAKLEAEGGTSFQKRAQIEADRHSIVQRLRAAEDELRHLAEGPAPLLLVAEGLARVTKQDDLEQSSNESIALRKILVKRDARVVQIARRSKTSKAVLKQLESFLAADREDRAKAIINNRYLLLDPFTRKSLRALQSPILREMESRISRLLATITQLSTDLLASERSLANIPSEDAIAGPITDRERAQNALRAAESQISLLSIELEQKKRQRDQIEAKLIRSIEQQVGKDFDKEDSLRTIAHSERVRDVLQKFRSETVRKHVTRIEALVLDSLQQLLRKQSLVSELRIDPERFIVELRNADGKIIGADRLSAGERQLLAVSLLWGLARVSGRPVPVVTDTPLGRLDASHRTHLVERYFPQASHQMLLLSTDKEIDREYYDRLKPWIGHSYRLEFNEKSGSTQIQPGYFW